MKSKSFNRIIIKKLKKNKDIKLSCLNTINPYYLNNISTKYYDINLNKLIYYYTYTYQKFIISNYTFSIYPNNYRPCGSVNFSRSDPNLNPFRVNYEKSTKPQLEYTPYILEPFIN